MTENNQLEKQEIKRSWKKLTFILSKIFNSIIFIIILFILQIILTIYSVSVNLVIFEKMPSDEVFWGGIFLWTCWFNAWLFISFILSLIPIKKNFFAFVGKFNYFVVSFVNIYILINTFYAYKPSRGFVLMLSPIYFTSVAFIGGISGGIIFYFIKDFLQKKLN